MKKKINIQIEDATFLHSCNINSVNGNDCRVCSVKV